jgi:hypothetical protein
MTEFYAFKKKLFLVEQLLESVYIAQHAYLETPSDDKIIL